MHLPITGIISGGGGSSILVYDTFYETSTTGLESHDPDIDVEGGGWYNIGTYDWRCGSGSYLYPVAFPNYNGRTYIEAGVADVTITSLVQRIPDLSHDILANVDDVKFTVDNVCVVLL